uniref:Uncharacterized protein n=1 Tax=Anguilla anguilla TaxID=7936 RepID=A0A0E9RVY2_ANGAN
MVDRGRTLSILSNNLPTRYGAAYIMRILLIPTVTKIVTQQSMASKYSP